MPSSPSSPHALIVPAAGQGHINGCMLLAKSLSSLGFSVSFVYFSTSYSQLKHGNRLPSVEDNPAIRIHVVPDGFEAGKPHGHFAVTTEMREGLEQLVEKLNHEGDPVTCLASDTFVCWTQDVADKFGIPRIDYWTASAKAYLMVTNISLLHSKEILPAKGSTTLWKNEIPVMVDCIPGLPPFPVEQYPKELRFAQFSDPFVQFFASIEAYSKRSERVLIHTVQDIETSAFAALGMAGIPAYAIGPLFHQATSQNSDAPNEECLKWLDKQATSSVIYVAFGSYASLSAEEIKELAIGLEASEQAFLWVIRADAVKDCQLSDLLPEGFQERTKERGMIISWAPQVKVLEHAAVGGFLTHCGWNSTMESLWAGVPLLGCPRSAEQRANVQYIAEVWKMGLELERTECGDLDRKGVEKGVRALMHDKEGEEAKCRTLEFKEAVRKASQKGGASVANLEKFYEDMSLQR